MSYGVEVGELRSSSEAAAQGADELRPVDLAGAVEGIMAALPGSVSEDRAGTLATVWDMRLKACTAQLENRAEKLSAAAETYSGNEGTAADNFGGMVRPR